MGESAAALRDEFMLGTDSFIGGRRGIVGLSIVSTGILGVIGLYQTGILKRLPPHLPLLNPEAVHGSQLAYSTGVTAPDAVLGMASYTTTAAWLRLVTRSAGGPADCCRRLQESNARRMPCLRHGLVSSSGDGSAHFHHGHCLFGALRAAV